MSIVNDGGHFQVDFMPTVAEWSRRTYPAPLGGAAWVRSPPTPTHKTCLLSAVGALKLSLVPFQAVVDGLDSDQCCRDGPPSGHSLSRQARRTRGHGEPNDSDDSDESPLLAGTVPVLMSAGVMCAKTLALRTSAGRNQQKLYCAGGAVLLQNQGRAEEKLEGLDLCDVD